MVLKIVIANILILGLNLSWWWILSVFAAALVDSILRGFGTDTLTTNFNKVLNNQVHLYNKLKELRKDK